VTPDEVYFSAVVKWGYCPETWRTPYKEVRKTLPGELVVLNATPYRVRNEVVDVVDVEEEVQPQDLKQRLERAAMLRAKSSDVPIAALVSGGLDSAIAYTLAKRHNDVFAYHAENGEALEASAVIGKGKCEMLPEVLVTTKKALSYMQEPVDLGSLVPQVALSDAIALKGGERVCLTGDGADELFGGYSRAQRYDSQASDVWHELVAWHLPRLDRVMMRNRVEVRSPFLARDVVQAALGLPRWMRTDKSILRTLFEDDLPPGVAARPKKALKTKTVEEGREKNSRVLVQEFRERVWV
jgi:asparagine synthase (glutamine-hydrolysing)